jgi:dimethylglycine dehydrogenase
MILTRLMGGLGNQMFQYACGKSLALAMVRPDLAVPGAELEIVILGVRHKATIITDSPFDPDNMALRS